jgi:hypothetical protein
MSCSYTSPQNGKVERIIRSVNNVICTVNNVIRTFLIQSSLPGRYWAKGLHPATYLLNRLPTTVIQAVCPHLALFGSAPSYEHLRVFGCSATLTRLPPRHISFTTLHPVSSWATLPTTGYRCLDLLTNRLIVLQHVVFYEDSFPLAVSPSLTDLDFLCESGPTISTIGTQLTTACTSTPTPRRPPPEIPPGFELPVAPLPAPALPS